MAKCYNKIYLKKQDITVDCQKCLNCIANKKRTIATRAILEMQNLKYRYFITLTYDNSELLKNGSNDISETDLKLFVKRARERVRRRMTYLYNEDSFVWIGSAEYGALTKRAHYHAIIASNAYIKHHIERSWKKGRIHIETDITNKAISYTCQYTTKKISTKEKIRKVQPFIKFKRGLGKRWIHEAIAKNYINPKHYYIELPDGRCKLPTYFKTIIKRQLTNTKVVYLNEKQRAQKIKELKDKKIAIFEHDYEYIEKIPELTIKKYIDINSNMEIDYYTYKNERLPKYEKYINEVKKNWIQTDSEFIDYLYLKNKYSNKKVFNSDLNTIDNIDNKIRFKEIMLENLAKKQRVKLKAEAESKYWKQVNTRSAI